MFMVLINKKRPEIEVSKQSSPILFANDYKELATTTQDTNYKTSKKGAVK